LAKRNTGQAFDLRLRIAILGAPTAAQPEQRRFVFFVIYAEAPVEMRQLGDLLVKVLRLRLGASFRNFRAREDS
jgi:hypothetical protein